MSCGCSSKSGPEFDPDFEGPSCDDLDRFGGDGSSGADGGVCPECGADVYHDAAVCPSCGFAITPARASSGWKGPMITVGAVAALAAFMFAFVI